MKNIEISPKEYERFLDWDDAIFYCQLLVIDNKTDWRLPTIEELKDIYHSRNDFELGKYWSSTIDRQDGAWLHNFKSNNNYAFYKAECCYIRAVRELWE